MSSTTIPGVTVNYTTTSAISQGSSASVPLLLVIVDTAHRQDSLDGYVLADTNTYTNKAVFTSPADVKADQYRGEYLFVSGLNEHRLIDANTQASAGDQVTVTVSRPFSSAPTAGQSMNVRKWTKSYNPQAYTTLDEFSNDWLDTDETTGEPIWTGSKHALAVITAAKEEGTQRFWAMVVDADTTSSALQSNLMCSANTDFVTWWESQAFPPTCIGVSHTQMPVNLSSSEWGSVVDHWETFVRTRATDSTVDSMMPGCYVVTDTVSTTDGAITWKTSTLTNEISPWVSVCHNYGNIDDPLNPGTTMEVNAAPFYIGQANRIITNTDAAFGHNLCGRRGRLLSVKSLSEDLTETDQENLGDNGINAMVNDRTYGIIFQNEWTCKKTTSTAGQNAEEHMHIMWSRNDIKNNLHKIIQDLRDEQGTVLNRGSVLAKCDLLLDNYVRRKILKSYKSRDATSSSDESLGHAKFNFDLLFPVGVKQINITINSRI